MKRPQLTEVPLPNTFPEPGARYMTVSPGQWDALLDEAYKTGWTLLEIEEVDGCEKAVRAYRSNTTGHLRPDSGRDVK